jgi:tetratricopeptide (TPR) repeat protein
MVANSPLKKEQLLTSAITQLTKEDNPLLLSNSYAYGHALYLRADARLEKSPMDTKGAINDARLAVQIVPKEIKAWRVLASAEEAGGNTEAAISAIHQWIKVDPSFATKAKKEIERLMSKQ